jgi:hypothetical protein
MMKDNKRLLYPLPEVVDPPRTCVQLYIPDDDWHVRAFWGHLLQLSRWWVWQRDAARTGKDVAAVWWDVFNDGLSRFYNGDPCPGESECNMYLRPKPGNPCILQYSNDNATWFDGFDFAACLASPSSSITNIDIDASKNYYDTIINNYDGTTGSIISTTYNRALLCWGIRAYVQSAVEAFIAYAEQQEAETDATLNIAAMILVAGAAIAGTIALGPAGGAAAGALAYGFLVGGTTMAVWAALDTTNLDDLRGEDAIEQVICCIMNDVAGSYPTFAAWQGPYTCSGLSSTAQRIKDIVDAQLNNEDAFAMMLGVMADYQPFEGLLPDCVCDAWCRDFAFGTNARGADGWTVVLGSVVTSSIAATGTSGTKQYGEVEYTFPSSVTITDWSTTYTIYPSGDAGGSVQFYLGGSEVTSARVNLPTGTDRTEARTGLTVVCDRIKVFVRDTDGTNPESGINTIQLTGKGAAALPWSDGVECP